MKLNQTFLFLFILLISLNSNAFESFLDSGENKSFDYKSPRYGDNYSIDYTIWNPIAPNNHLIIYNHGLQSHRAWFYPTAEKLVTLGFTVVAFDRIGSGTSQGESIFGRESKGHINSWKKFVGTLKAVVEKSQKEFPEHSIHLWGNSYGAKVVTAYLLMYPTDSTKIASTVFTTPGLYRDKMNMPANPITVVIPMLSPLHKSTSYIPSVITESKNDNGANWFTNEPNYFKLIKQDELSLRKMTKKFLKETKEMDRYIARKSKRSRNGLKSQKRFYLMVESDKMMDNQKMLDHISLNEETAVLEFYQGGRENKHFLLFTEDSDEALDDIVQFLIGVI